MMESDKACRYVVVIAGIVQGVGFRPFVYRLAKSLYLNGSVNNISDGVMIEVEGETSRLDAFVSKLKSEAPPISFIKDLKLIKKEPKGLIDFIIKQSSKSQDNKIYFSPDISICKDCAQELFNESDERHLYPFINCTNCGPRFTLIKGVPYDRINTTMDKFRMCESCEAEFSNPFNRRYHAQPISCYNCGPELRLTDKNRRILSSGLQGKEIAEISMTRKLILDGKIIAIKGIGGYHLVCDAKNEKAVKELRSRKIRDDKPFALMAKDYNTALKYCEISSEERELLESAQKPIVLLRKSQNNKLTDLIAPGNPNLGMMLPYTPLHMLLFNDNNIEILVMTSANRSSEPIYYEDEEAFENLADIADYFLTNNRDIFIRTDDSVTRVFNKREFIIRRSRGYVPLPITFDANIFAGSEINIAI